MSIETVVTMPAAPVADIIGEAARHLASGDAQAALDALQGAAAIDASSLRLRFMTGLIAWRLADVQQALTTLRDCHDEAPMNGTIAEVLASLYAQAGNLAESLYFGKLSTALGSVADFATLVPPQFPSFGLAFLSIRERPLFARAKMLVNGGQLLDGLDLARQHVSLNPRDEEARLFLGEGLLRAGGAAAAANALAPVATSASASPAALSLFARALAAVGERRDARDYHERACAAAPDDAAIAAARLADSLWIADDAVTVQAWVSDWVGRLSPPLRKGARGPAHKKLIIGYALSALADPRDAAAIAAVARAHDRAATTVIGYGIGAQSWRENAPFTGAFDKWRDIAGLDPATLARILAGDGLGVVIDCSGAAAPRQLMAIGRLASAVRVAWLGLPEALGAPLYDATLGRAAEGIPRWGADAAYPLMRDWLRAVERTPSAVPRFASDIRLNQLDERTVALWSAVLAGAPEATLLLRANDMAPGANVERLIARFGRELAARIDLVDATTPDEFYRDADVALAPVKGTSPRLAAEASACGIPVVALDGDGPGEVYGAFLRRLGLGGSLVAADDRDYVSIALGLAGSATAREQLAAEVAAAAQSGQESARRIAEVIEREALVMTSGDVRP
ncbi:MAG TPA: glycosyltransferase [Stellaceae bacterium]|nr:glycosyltransferase [Stellaceae bacterium]